MKKISLLLFGILLLTNCDDEPLEGEFFGVETEQNNPENTLLINQINNGNLDFFFDTEGKIETVKNTDSFTSNDITYQFEYTTDQRLETQTNYFASEQASTTLTYSNNNISNFAFVTLGSSFSESITISYNKVSYINTSNTTNPRNIEFTFATNNLKKLMHYEVTIGFQPTNIIDTSIDYSYDINGNLSAITENVLNQNPVNNTYSFSYDSKKNPVAESMENNTLAYLISQSYHVFILERLIQLSPNNILSNGKDEHTFTYQYNLDNYPETGVKVNSTNNAVINNLTYIYY